MARPPKPVGRRDQIRHTRRFDPFRPIDMLASMWSATAMAPVNTGAAAAYRTLFMTMRRLVVGRRLTVRLDDGDLTMTVTKFDSRLDVRGLSVGQLNDVTLIGRNIHWGASTFDHATVVLHNVHMKPTSPPVLVAAPVDLTLEVSTKALDDLFHTVAPRLRGEVGADGVARLHMARRPGIGHVEVDARLDGSALWLAPRGVTIGSSRWRLPARTPAYRVRLPEFEHGLQLTGVDFTPGVVRLTGTMPEWRTTLPRKRLEDIITQLDVSGVVLNLSRLGRLR
ncbi:hypothetical protein NGTWS0302_37920 [Mycolicibacterium cyprinidarum]|uniref:DUF2993 domain-containing protein n=1 Tax=Mycolicibacterium cyprinidarum TaxID=2860311 RepID=A0ABQ4VC35_9MYCO|nr:hypothetical protein NGTWS1803_14200 [Mycolicibacterium sp. NGTWS1803]GJF10319.1 hypothetical protein NGTWS1702_05900 [Mycolicibacterium sp. NGTWSNA01]GJF15120.1 hypothetical protein NGTWS0302_37920 [Mycolicibacterium sp. NGTWS0302]